MRTTLRDRLRIETGPQHQRVDDVFSVLDPASRYGLGDLLYTTRAALLGVVCHDGPHAKPAERMRREILDALGSDLRELGVPCDTPVAAQVLDATAVYYILLGSRAGSRLMHRQWCGSIDPVARSAGRYLCLEARAAEWRVLRDELSVMSDEGDAADRIVADAARMFDLYLDGARALPIISPAKP